MIKLNPDCPDQTVMEFGEGDILCGEAVNRNFTDETKTEIKSATGIGYYYNSLEKLEVGERINSQASPEIIPLPNVIMVFKGIESLDIVIRSLQRIRHRMENIDEKETTIENYSD